MRYNLNQQHNKFDDSKILKFAVDWIRTADL